MVSMKENVASKIKLFLRRLRSLPKKIPMFRNFLRVWTLYGSTFAGAVGSLMLIGITAMLAVLELIRSSVPRFNALFQSDGLLSSFELTVSNGLEYFGMSFVMLLLVWVLLATCALIPATIVGLVYEVLNKYLRSEKGVLAVTYGLAGLFSSGFWVAATGWQFDDISFLIVPLALVAGLVACNITLRFRRDVLESKQASYLESIQR